MKHHLNVDQLESMRIDAIRNIVNDRRKDYLSHLSGVRPHEAEGLYTETVEDDNSRRDQHE